MVSQLRRFTTKSLLLTITTFCVANAQYRSFRLDERGQLYLTSQSGQETLAPKLPDQGIFTDPLLSDDRTMVGWLAGYVIEDATHRPEHPLSGNLVLYRAGRIQRTFKAEQVFWSWRFADHDRSVAFCTGPTHGGAAQCELRSIASGKRRACWYPRSHTAPPAWAVLLHF